MKKKTKTYQIAWYIELDATDELAAAKAAEDCIVNGHPQVFHVRKYTNEVPYDMKKFTTVDLFDDEVTPS